MVFTRLVQLAANLHCFSPGMLTAGESLDQVRVQLNRWVNSGRVVRIKKGWYTLSEPYRRVRIDMNVIACTIKSGTYVSLQSALAFHGMIPEHVAETTCVTTGRPLTIDTPFGRISYRHIKREVFFGYSRYETGVQHAYVAVPEKALLDLLYLTPCSESSRYISELRLQGMEDFDVQAMLLMARRFQAPRLERAVGTVSRLVTQGSAFL